ncbi:C-C motif chemokine 25 [Siniperca chuatsi]|uniref:C-C motif chemokine 25-like protein n=1 Tax=Siniperca chuatsi TaxID=119488 RepID=A0A0E3GPE5_SINCH|nr:C-C motif chemokine 25 [Siniperca chuatsi]AKA66310.1 C-C motif chemokine 25-like protein [Siniperca chuatsi]
MQVNTLFFLLITSCLCLALAQVTYDDCCLKYVKKMSHSTQRYAMSYRRQVTDGGCNIPAIIFTMRKGRVFCTDPEQKWVIELMTKIDNRKAKKDRKNTFRKHHPRRP